MHKLVAVTDEIGALPVSTGEHELSSATRSPWRNLVDEQVEEEAPTDGSIRRQHELCLPPVFRIARHDLERHRLGEGSASGHARAAVKVRHDDPASLSGAGDGEMQLDAIAVDVGVLVVERILVARRREGGMPLDHLHGDVQRTGTCRKRDSGSRSTGRQPVVLGPSPVRLAELKPKRPVRRNLDFRCRRGGWVESHRGRGGERLIRARRFVCPYGEIDLPMRPSRLHVDVPASLIAHVKVPFLRVQRHGQRATDAPSGSRSRTVACAVPRTA